ncbi:MAG TPA: Ppx/GppA family phosphatase [Solirubrobacteraceae bacterium]|nr:Ppx/GppA family phosphatase [Solirubrobacteraceae bacterium]
MAAKVYGPGPLVRTAVVDIGTNSTRLLVADVRSVGILTERVRRSVVTRLGDGLEAGGRLRPDARERVFGVVEDYAATIAGEGAERALAVMTSAVRDAADGREFAAELRERTGLDGRILSGDEEAALTFAGATATRSADGLLVVDVGGGSTELVAAGFHASLQVGVVRHGERHLHDDPPAPAQLAALAADVRAAIAAAGVPDGLPVRELVAVAGTATSCAAIDLALTAYDTTRIEGHVLRRPTLEALRDRLAALPLSERREVTGLHPDRAPVIVPGILILLEVLDHVGADAVVASDRDILHGVARTLAEGKIPRTGEPN